MDEFSGLDRGAEGGDRTDRTLLGRLRGARFVEEAHCDESRITVLGGRVLVVCPHRHPRFVKTSGDTSR